MKIGCTPWDESQVLVLSAMNSRPAVVRADERRLAVFLEQLLELLDDVAGADVTLHPAADRAARVFIDDVQHP